MVGYIFGRILQVVPLLIALSIVSFLIIELPPGDYLTSLILRLEQSGKQLNDEEVLRLKKQYGLDRSAVVRYSMWMWNILSEGDFGRSFTWQRPVAEVITERIVLTMVISIATLLFTWVVAVPA
ncbi:MAG: ABC transporter permease, partial [Spirochaetaceae bacterium]|nr:ABC transporter permease [Spirochaetaceae bacterium]